MSRTAPLDVTCVILTFNEELHLDRCLSAIAPHVARTVIVDSISTDRTLAIAQEYGAQVLQNPFVNHALQFNWGLTLADIKTAWTLRLDADEYFTAEGLDAVRELVANAPADIGAVAFRRGVVFRGCRIRHGGIDEVMLTRLWRTGQARIEARWMDEHVEVLEGSTYVETRGAIVDETLRDLHWFTRKHNAYATRQMVEHILRERGKQMSSDSKLNVHAAAKRAMRERLYVPAPMFWRALAYFVYRYLGKGGWRDGRAGLVYHGLQGLWNFMLVDMRLTEARATISRIGWNGFVEELKKDHGIDLTDSADEPTL